MKTIKPKVRSIHPHRDTYKFFILLLPPSPTPFFQLYTSAAPWTLLSSSLHHLATLTLFHCCLFSTWLISVNLNSTAGAQDHLFLKNCFQTSVTISHPRKSTRAFSNDAPSLVAALPCCSCCQLQCLRESQSSTQYTLMSISHLRSRLSMFKGQESRRKARRANLEMERHPASPRCRSLGTGQPPSPPRLLPLAKTSKA